MSYSFFIVMGVVALIQFAVISFDRFTLER